MQTIAEMPEFIKQADRLLSASERETLIAYLAKNQTSAAVLKTEISSNDVGAHLSLLRSSKKSCLAFEFPPGLISRWLIIALRRRCAAGRH